MASIQTGTSFQGAIKRRLIGLMDLRIRPGVRRKPQPPRNRRGWVESATDPNCLILCGAPGRN